MTDAIQTGTAVRRSEPSTAEFEYIGRVSERDPEIARRLRSHLGKPGTKEAIQNCIRQARYRARELKRNPTEFRAYKAKNQAEYARRNKTLSRVPARGPLTEDEIDRLRTQFREESVRLTAWLTTDGPRQRAWRPRKNEIRRARVALMVYRASHSVDPRPAKFAPYLGHALKRAIPPGGTAGRWLKLLRHLEEPGGPFFAAEPKPTPAEVGAD